MTNKLRRWAITVFCAYMGFVLAGLAFYGVVDDSPFVPLMNGDLALGLSWLVVAGASGIALLAVVVGGLPVGFAVAKRAIRAERRNLALLAVPLVALGALIATVIVIFFVASSYANPDDIPASVSATASALFSIVFVLAAIASTASVCLAVVRTDAATGEQVFRAKGIIITVEPYSFALIPAAVATLAMAVMLLGTLAWGLIAMSNAPQLFGLSSGFFGMSNAVIWALTIVAMAAATTVAAGAAARWARVERDNKQTV